MRCSGDAAGRTLEIHDNVWGGESTSAIIPAIIRWTNCSALTDVLGFRRKTPDSNQFQSLRVNNAAIKGLKNHLCQAYPNDHLDSGVRHRASCDHFLETLIQNAIDLCRPSRADNTAIDAVDQSCLLCTLSRENFVSQPSAARTT